MTEVDRTFLFVYECIHISMTHNYLQQTALCILSREGEQGSSMLTRSCRIIVERLSRDISVLHVSLLLLMSWHPRVREPREHYKQDARDDERPAFATLLIQWLHTHIYTHYTYRRAIRPLMAIQFTAHPPIKLDCSTVIDSGTYICMWQYVCGYFRVHRFFISNFN